MSSPKPAIYKRPVIYGAIISGGYAIDLATYVLLVAAGLHLYLAYLAAFLVGATCNVVLLRRYLAAPRYSFVTDLGLTLGSNGALIALAFVLYVGMIRLLDVQHLVAKIISNLFSVTLNYYTRRRYF